MDSNSTNIPRLDREFDKVLSTLDSVIEECIGNQSPFDSAFEVSQEYLEDLKDGVQDQSDEHYQAQDQAIKIKLSLESTDEMTKGDLTDQMKRQEEAIQTAEQVVSEPPPARLSKPDLILAAQYYIKRDNKKLGPVSGDTILKNFRDGKVKTSDEISESGEGPWVEMKDSELLSLV